MGLDSGGNHYGDGPSRPSTAKPRVQGFTANDASGTPKEAWSSSLGQLDSTPELQLEGCLPMAM